jgi:OOP family OmpA-OmpF porin
MKIAQISGAIGVVALAAFAGPFAAAQDDTGWYVGAGVGRSHAKIDDPRIIDGLSAQGFSTDSISDDNRDTGYKLFGGYQFNRNFALEGGYFYLGRFGFTADTAPAGTLNGSIKLRGVNLDAVGFLPFTGKLSAFGRTGADYSQARDAFSGAGLVDVTNPSPSKNCLNYKLGLGLQYAFNESLAMRLEAERYRIDDAVGNKGDIDLYSVGLVYRFGQKSPVAVAPPEPVAAYVAPPALPPVPAPVLAKMDFAVDSLFDFAHSDIKPEGKQTLNKFAADLKGTRIDAIKVTGHADRLGRQAYNQALSTRRAEAVKSYLVQSAGIAEGKITANGVDGTDPVTKPGDCKGEKATRKLIACLQPDRRVEVEVTGTR